MNTLRKFFIILFAAGSCNPAFSDRTSVPFLCNNIYKILPQDSVQQIQLEDKGQREMEAARLLGPQGLARIEQALGLAPFQKIQTEQEALQILESIYQNPDVARPINQTLQEMNPSRRWALYLLTGFHAVSTHTDGHRAMVQQGVSELPKSALLGGNSPSWLDVGIGNANFIAAGMANNPKAFISGMDIAGGSLNRSMAVLNLIADQLQTLHAGPKMFDYGRFNLIRGSASDPTLLQGRKFDGVSWVLTLFSVPKKEREQALRISADTLVPGGKLVFIDPTPALHGPEGKSFLRQIIRNAFQNNEELTVLDVAILTAMNAHGVFKTDFMTPTEQTALGKKVGLAPVGPAEPVYYGIASKQTFEKPWLKREQRETDRDRSSLPTAPLKKKQALYQLQQKVEDQLRIRLPEAVSVKLADNSERGAITKFIQEQRKSLGVHVPDGIEADLKDIETAYQKKGGFLFYVKDSKENIIGTFAFSPVSEGVAEIKKMYLAEDYRKQGLGEKFLDSMIQFAVQRGFSQVYAETTPKLQSHNMFMSSGFEEMPQPASAANLQPGEAYWLKKDLPQIYRFSFPE